MTDETTAAKKKGQSKEAGAKRSKLPLVIVTALMLGEGAAILLVAKIMFGPSPLEPLAAAEIAEGEAKSQAETTVPRSETAEVQVADCRPSNKATGRPRTFRLRVAALVRTKDAQTAASLLEANRARIEDRVNFVIRSAESQHLEEPGLETIKRRMKSELDQILGNEKLILEILIPELLEA